MIGVLSARADGFSIGRDGGEDEWYCEDMDGSMGGSIDVRLFAGLETRTPRGASHLRIPADQPLTLAGLFARLELPRSAVGLRLVNGLHAGLDDALHPGDEVSLFPPLGGG